MMEGGYEPEVAITPTLAEDPALGLSHRAKMEILFAVLLGMFLGALDQTIVGTALPKIITQLNGNDLYTWVVTIYLLTSTISVPFWGKLSDIYGRRPMFMIGIVIFLIGSALSGLSQNMGMLIAFRGLQGIGAGSLFPVALAVIGDLFSPAERGKYQGLFGASFGIAALIGPALGGYITDTISWHWIFYINLPVGAISLYFIWHLLPTVKRANATRNFDILGAFVFTAAIAFLLVGLTNESGFDAKGVANTWTSFPVGGFLVIGLVGIVAFILVEARAKEPIIPPNLFRNRTYATSMIATFFAAFGFFGAIIFLPRYFQFVLGSSATLSGYQSLPLLVGLIFASVISGQVVARTGRYKWLTVASILILAVGLVMMTQLRADTPLPALWFWMFVTGVGIGPTLATFTIIVQNAVPFNVLGVATANLTFFRQIGGSVALAITGAIFGTTFAERIPAELTNAGVPAQISSQFAAGGPGAAFDPNQLAGVGEPLGQLILHAVPAQFQALVVPYVDKIVLGIHQAFTDGIVQTFSIGIGATILAAVAAAAMHEHPLRAHAPQTAAAKASTQPAQAVD